jgi:rhomboid protease GluP
MKFRLSRAPVTAALLAVITVVFIFEMMTGAPFDTGKLIALGAIVPGMLQDGAYWRIFAAMFLHASVPHWFVNCWALYQLGALYEQMFGSVRFGTVYLVTGACASIASSMHVDNASVGASGAVLGILGAFIFSIKRSPQWRNEPWTKGLISQLLFWAGLNIVIGFAASKYIDNVAHIAGLVSGLILGFIPHRVPPPPPSRTIVDVQPYGEPRSTLPEDHS